MTFVWTFQGVMQAIGLGIFLFFALIIFGAVVYIRLNDKWNSYKHKKEK